MKYFFTSIIILLLITSCSEKPNIVGLWKVISVTVEGEEKTPNGRWMRFYENKTQDSGNGWLQHSEGTWSLNPESSSLKIINSNGLNDLNEPFTVILSPADMIWKRTEDGQEVIIKMIRIKKLPKTYSDALFGLWQLEKAVGNGPYVSSQSMGGLFFRWDKRFVYHTENGQINGVFNTHGHKSEVEFIPYGDLKRSFWDLEIDETSLNLKLLNSDSLVTRSFKRIHEFPE